MNLFVIRYLFPLVFEGKKTNPEMSKVVGGTLSNVSHAMCRLYALGLVKHPEGRAKSWAADHTKKTIQIIEKLLLVAKNDKKIKELLIQPLLLKSVGFFIKIKRGQ